MGGRIVRGKRARATLPVVLILSVAILAPAAALAKGAPRGGGGGGHLPPTVTPNNLSVPTIMVGSSPFSATCGADSTSASTLSAPTGTPRALYDIDGDGVVESDAYYFVQGVHTWQAECYKATSASATAAWGDNLGGDASLKVGSPVRVELGLFDDAEVSMDGYTVVKLEPLKLDRESAYGTLATQECWDTDEDGVDDECEPYEASPTTFSPVRVYDSGVTLAITDADGACAVGDVCPIDPTAEINATGAVVYGYNWRPDEPGDYTISFTTSTNVSITGTDVGTVEANETCVPAEVEGDPDVCTPTGSYTVSLDVTVAGGGGGGGGNGYHGH